METGVHVGSKVTPASLEKLGEILLAILRAPHADEKTKRAAIAALAAAHRVEGLTVSHCAVGDRSLTVDLKPLAAAIKEFGDG